MPKRSNASREELSLQEEDAMALAEQQPNEFTFDMGAFEEKSKKFFSSLPRAVQDRVTVLKKLQGEYSTIQKAFVEEMRKLELKYSSLSKPLLERRSEIVTGSKDISEEELSKAKQWKEEEEKKNAIGEVGDDDEKEKKVEESAPASTGDKEDEKDVKGIPNFWFEVLKKSEIYDDMVQEHDEDSLTYIEDITLEHFDADNAEEEKEEPKSRGFKIHFHYKENPYFKNKVLTKTYYLNPEDNQSISKSEGCEIEWKSDEKNLTIDIQTKKQKHKSGKQTRKVKKKVPRDSFYNFFKKLELEVDEEEDEDEAEQRFEDLMEEDAEIGAILKDNIIPHAVEFYLGEIEANVDQMLSKLYLNSEEDDDDPENDLDENDDEEEEVSKKKKGGRGQRAVPDSQQPGGDNPECKQQ